MAETMTSALLVCEHEFTAFAMYSPLIYSSEASSSESSAYFTSV